MDFPEKLDYEALLAFLQIARRKKVNPIFTDGQVVVASLMDATKVALFERGSVIATYQLRGDETWRRTSSPPS
jgi:hypothetical protein